MRDTATLSSEPEASMIRLFDVLFSILGLILLTPVFLVLVILCCLDTGSPLFMQCRLGRHQQRFTLVKFRTMHLATESVATHLVDANSVTILGHFLRRTKLDELPQLWNVLLGDMSIVGPRPCLCNQEQLIMHRLALAVFDARPGITGLAQIRGIDMSTPQRLAEIDAEMLKCFTLYQYFRLIVLTAFRTRKETA